MSMGIELCHKQRLAIELCHKQRLASDTSKDLYLVLVKTNTYLVLMKFKCDFLMLNVSDIPKNSNVIFKNVRDNVEEIQM
jgi:hypothetical protein